MDIREITPDIFYCGVNDRVTHLFEALWPLPYGVSYNSYIVKGDKTALVDCVEISEIRELIENIRSVIGKGNLDFLVVNHMEPDHTGGIPLLLEAYPDLKIIGNAQTVGMLKGYYHVEDSRIMVIKDLEEVDLGGITLQFFLTPMVHWPETMMTYVKQNDLLFSGDALGAFGALNGGVVDEEMDTELYFSEMERYYSNIVGKYGRFVQRALAKVLPLGVKYVCPTHGPVWHRDLSRTVEVYDRLSKCIPDKDMATIVYGSMYGNTADVAEAIGRGLSARGIKKIRIYNASNASMSRMITDAFKSSVLIIGSPTYSMSLFPPVASFIDAIAVREVKNKVLGTFGSYTWSPAAPKLLAQAADRIGLPLTAELSLKQSADEDTLKAIDEFAAKIIAAHDKLTTV